MIELIKYEDTEQFNFLIEQYQLNDLSYTGTPLSIIENSILDSNRIPVMILLNQTTLIGFFCLHINEGPKFYGYDGNDILLRAYSIDERYRKKGYATKSLLLLNDFIKLHFQDINKIILAVNQKNINAQMLYLKSGFKDLKKRQMGNKGQLYLFEKEII